MRGQPKKSTRDETAFVLTLLATSLALAIVVICKVLPELGGVF